MYSRSAGAGPNVRHAADASLAQARTASMRIYDLLANPTLSAKACLASAHADPKRAMKLLLMDVHPGKLGVLPADDAKLLGLAANVVATAYLAVTQPTAKSQAAFAEACKFAREEAAWAKSYVGAARESQQLVAHGDIYEPASVVRARQAVMPVLTADPKHQAMLAGVRAALQAYEEIMALGEPEQPRISIFV